MLAVPDGEERLAAPREATTLWRDVAGNGDLRVGTLAQMGAPALEVAAPGAFVNVDADAHCTVVQIVKRDGTYVPVVDGVVVRSFQHGGREVYPITAHRGLHHDPVPLKPGARAAHAFSPCAVAVVIEDGELLPSECKLRVWQQFGHEGQLIGAPALCGDAAILPTQVHTNLANVVYTPYPMTADRKPRVVIYDMRRTLKYQLSDAKTAALKFFNTPDTQNGLKEFVQTVFKGNEPYILSLVLSVLDGLNFSTEGFGTEAGPSSEPRQQALRRIRLGQLRAQSFAGIAMLMAQLTGNPFLSVGASAAGSAYTAYQTEYVWGFGPKDNLPDGMRLVLGFTQGLFTGLVNWVSKPPPPQPDKVYFTLDELASALDVLGSIATMSLQELRIATGKHHYRREAVVWAWLLHKAKKWSATLLQKDPNTGYFSNNTVDVREIGDDAVQGKRRAPVTTTVEVHIVDPGVCADQTRSFEFLCHRDDSHLLALARSGMIESIDRLAAAVERLEQRLQDAIDDQAGCLSGSFLEGGVKAACYFWDLIAYGPFGIFVYDTVFKPLGAEKLQAYLRAVPYNAKGLNGLETQRVGLLQVAKKNCGIKLGSEFVAFGGPAQRLKRAIQAALVDAIPPSLALQRPTVLRTLPHKVKRAPQLYPSPDMIALEHFDVEGRGVMTREQSAFSDTVRETGSTFTREQAALRHLVTKWERGPNRLILKAAHDALTAARLGAAYELPEDSYGLVIQLPRDVQAAASAIAEPERRRMQLIADRSQPSALKRVFKGLKEVEATFVALSVYCEFWTSELVLRSRQPPYLAERARSFALASHWAAASRAEACGQLVLDTTAQSPVGFFAADDPIMQATQAGRDARILARRMGGLDVSADANDVRYIREVASELFRIAKIAGAASAAAIPSEPLQSLFIDPNHGEYAFRRALFYAAPHQALECGNAIVSSICSAYPSLLVDRTLHDPPSRPAPGANPLADPQPVRPDVGPPTAATQRALAKRAAELRIDFPSIDRLEASNVAGLANAFATQATIQQECHFYVPFGFGDAPPPLTALPVSAIMFGSVPVWPEDWLAALQQTLQVRYGAAATGAVAAGGTRLVPQRRGCGASPLPAPMLVRVRGGDTYTYFASATPASPGEAALIASVATAVAPGARIVSSAAAAAAQLQSAESLALTCAVEEIAWNAERTLQCILLAASRSDQAALDLVCVLPDTFLPPAPGGLDASLVALKRDIERAMSMLYDAIRAALKSMKATIEELRKVDPLDADKTRFARWFGEAEGGDPLSKAIVHPDGTATPSAMATGAPGTDDDGFGYEEEEPARPRYGSFNYGSILSVLLNLGQVRDVVANGVRAVVAAASAASTATTADAVAAVYTMAAAHPALFTAAAAAAVYATGTGILKYQRSQIKSSDALIKKYEAMDVDALTKAQLFAYAGSLQDDVEELITAMYDDERWKAEFLSKLSTTRTLSDLQFAQRLRQAMGRALRNHEQTPETEAFQMRRLAATATRHFLRLGGFDADRRRLEDADALRAAQKQAALQQATKERRRLLLANVLGVAMARVMLGGSSGGGPRIVDVVHEQTTMSNADIAAELAALRNGLGRLELTVQAGQGRALRFNEACAISELVTVL